MNTCRDFHDALLAAALERPAADSTLARHLGLCAECRGVHARMQRMYSAIAALEPLRAPAELEGRVVAATQAGQRQERVMSHLRAMLRHEAPHDLAAKLSDSSRPLLDEASRVRAPSVLDRLVEEELRDPEKAFARRYVSRLQRVGAPASLRERVARMLESPRRSSSRRYFVAGSALLLLVAGLWTWIQLEWLAPHKRPVRHFEVEFVDDIRQIDPIARELLHGATGGWSELKKEGG